MPDGWRRYAEAVEILTEVSQLLKKCNEVQTMAAAYGNLGICHFHLGNVDDAISNFQTQLMEAARLRALPERELVGTYKRLAMLYWNANRDRARALEYIARGEAVVEENMREGVVGSGVVTLEGSWGAFARSAIEDHGDIRW